MKIEREKNLPEYYMQVSCIEEELSFKSIIFFSLSRGLYPLLDPFFQTVILDDCALMRDWVILDRKSL